MFLARVLLVFCFLPILGTEQSEKQKYDDKTLNALFPTQKSGHVRRVLSRQLIQRGIAPFAIPQQSHAYPIDFLVNATIIPEEWEWVYDIGRDAITRKVKILTGRTYKTLYYKLHENFLIASLPATIAVIGDGGMSYNPPSSAITAATFVTCTAMTMFLQNKSQGEARSSEFLISDLSTRSIESSFIMPNTELYNIEDAYFREDLNMIKVKMRGASSRFFSKSMRYGVFVEVKPVKSHKFIRGKQNELITRIRSKKL